MKTKKLPYYRNTAEKKEKETPLHLLDDNYIVLIASATDVE